MPELLREARAKEEQPFSQPLGKPFGEHSGEEEGEDEEREEKQDEEEGEASWGPRGAFSPKKKIYFF